jgi:hypothetical protein
MPDDAPVMSAYPALLAALPLPVGEGREAEANNFDNDEDGSRKVELFATDDDVVNLRNVRSWSDACARRFWAHRTACALRPLSHVQYTDDTDPKDWNGSHVRWWLPSPQDDGSSLSTSSPPPPNPLPLRCC